MAETEDPLLERSQLLEQSDVEAPPRITDTAAFQTAKAATEHLVQTCVEAAGVMRVAILIGLTRGFF
jgi:hypothetical protein